MGTEGSSKVSIVDWTPPWLDNGRRLHQVVDALVKLNDRAMWQVVMKVMTTQLEYDLAVAREVNMYTEKFENDD